MNTTEIFKEQIDKGAVEMFFYGIETPTKKVGDFRIDIRIDIKSHKGSLDTFPDNLEFVRMMTPILPLFRKKQ